MIADGHNRQPAPASARAISRSVSSSSGRLSQSLASRIPAAGSLGSLWMFGMWHMNSIPDILTTDPRIGDLPVHPEIKPAFWSWLQLTLHSRLSAAISFLPTHSQGSIAPG